MNIVPPQESEASSGMEEPGEKSGELNKPGEPSANRTAKSAAKSANSFARKSGICVPIAEDSGLIVPSAVGYSAKRAGRRRHGSTPTVER